MAESMDFIDYTLEEVGKSIEFGEIVKCEKCGKPAIERGLRVKKHFVQFIHKAQVERHGSRRKNAIIDVCLMDGGEIAEVSKKKDKD